MLKNIQHFLKTLLLIMVMCVTPMAFGNTLDEFSVLRDIDRGTFNEYRYRMVQSYFELKSHYEIKGEIKKETVSQILNYAKIGYNYLPDSLKNKNYYNDLEIAIKKSIDSPHSEVIYEEVLEKLDTYIQEVSIEKIRGEVEVTPKTGNAPLTVTFRGKVTDPTGAVIPASNYIWWMSSGGVKRVIGSGQSIHFPFQEEGNYSVFLDVKSSHKNAAGYTDVLPFSSRGEVEVKEKVASLILKINSIDLKDSGEIKFSPEESSYGLIFDATSSTPTGGAKFKKTSWSFGNGVEKSYEGAPKVERVVYAREGNYPVTLTLLTNEGREVKKEFVVAIHKPIATIQSNKDEGYIGEKFTFSARSGVNQKNLSFTWNLIDITNDKILLSKEGNTFNHSFVEKGRFNLQLKVKDSAGNEDTDTKIISINSREPIADFSATIPNSTQPNTVLLDGTKSYDPDFSDNGKLKYVWMLDGERIDLKYLDQKGAIGYYTFNSIGNHSISLEVTDPDNLNSIKTQQVKISSLLSVDFIPLPRVARRMSKVNFSVTAPKAQYFEWDFGDGTKEQSTTPKMTHIYQKSGVFNVKLVVKDIDGNTNTITKVAYVSDSNSPYAVIDLGYSGGAETPGFDPKACGNGAYIVDRTRPVLFKGSESVNLDGTGNGLSYTWKIGQGKYLTTRDVSHKFDELGCYPVKLTLKSDKNGKTHLAETWVKVENLLPTYSSLSVSLQGEDTDPVVVNVQAMGATDPDGVIQSYLWYYYTDTDSEPQDFRITSVPSTNFVIPKISGNYYFVLVMRDNNDGKISTQDNSENKYFISLTGDNINTPLVDFKTSKSNIYIGEEISFSTKVKNVLGNDLTSKSEYAWDFDGDGFYDKETTTPDITYKYEKSGTFYAKVRVKYKGMTNVRTLEINVANMLEPNFKYVSFGDRVVFFNTSLGTFDSVVWDMGDGNKVENKNYFTYQYEDGKPSHKVNLRIAEGTKVKTIALDVKKDIKGVIDMKNAQDIYLLSQYEIEDDTIILDDQEEKIVFFIGEKSGTQNYGIDYNIEIDSDLNGSKDDDLDNHAESSYNNAGIVEIPLDDMKNQTIRFYTLDNTGNILDSRDIKIEKNYIKIEEINPDEIVFEGVSDQEKVKIEQLKNYIQGFPQEHRLKAMQYVQKLQEEWFYLSEKTKIILEFEGFVDSLGLPNGGEIINLLESFLVEGQEDQSVRGMAYNVVKNLIPKELVEYDDIIKSLEQIQENPGKVEENKVLGREILEYLGETSLLTIDEKLLLKTQLQVLIYGGVDNIPQEIVEEVKKESGGNKALGLLGGTLKFIVWIFLGLIGILFGFFIWFKISNKNENQGLQDFIIEKTSRNEDEEREEEKKVEVKKPEETLKDPFLENTSPTPDTLTRSEVSQIKEAEKPLGESPASPPDWMQFGGEISAPTTSDPQISETIVDPLQNENLIIKQDEQNQEEVVEESSQVGLPDWLNSASFPSNVSDFDSVENGTTQEKIDRDAPESILDTPQEIVEGGEEITLQDSKDESTLVEENNTQGGLPAWLSGGISQEKEEEKEVSGKEEILPESSEIETKIKDDEVPDWLKGVIGDTSTHTPQDHQEENKKGNSTQKGDDFWTLDGGEGEEK